MREIIIKSAMNLNEKQIKRIKDKAISIYGKKIQLKIIIDINLIGGIIIYDNGEIIDSTIIKQLNDIKLLLKN